MPSINMLILAFLVFSVSTTAAISDSSSTQVKLNTKLGTVVGTTSTVVLGDNVVHRFLGIPYAKAPVGSLRFAKPQPYGKFNNGSHDSREFASECPQYDDNKQIGNEDCLFLNVFVPKITDKTLKSTMIWIHGGGFTYGAADHYPADALTGSGDVVIVTINYRVNVFGFLTNGDSRVAGNYGLWDQKLAIQWVKDNIADYGGDPNSITLFGESAGARSVSFQMFSPTNTAELFQRGIAESGSALSLTYLNRNPLPVFSTVSEYVGCSDGEKILSCLRSIPMNQLLEASILVERPYPFFPIVDGDFLPHDLGAMLSNYSATQSKVLIQKAMGDFGSYDLLGGWNNQEGFYFFPFLDQANKNTGGNDSFKGVSLDVLKDALKELPFHNYPTDNITCSTIVDMYINYYVSNRQHLVSKDRSVEEQNLEIYSEISGDVILKLPVIQLLQVHSAVSARNTFAYEFQKKRSKRTQLFPSPDWLRIGATHADEISYVFGYPEWTGEPEKKLQNILRCFDCTEEDRKISRKMMSHWSNFAKTGHPGDPFEIFNYPEGQLYTVINGSLFGNLNYPSYDKTQLWSAVDSALMYAVRSNTDISSDGSNELLKRRYLFGLLTLADNEVDLLIAGLIWLSTQLLLILLTVCCRARKSSTDSQKKEK